jgi:ABC-2 type transport system ATP-binding protein
MSKQAAIQVHGLSKTFGEKRVIDDLSFIVEKGTIFGLLGHNGAGKSTTIDCILGTQKCDSARISLLGRDPKAERKRLFQYVGVQFQESAFQNQLKVREICEITHSLYENPLNWMQALHEFGLAAKLNSFLGTLSGGEKQKLCILLAIMGNPQIIFLDELTTGLDPQARREVWRYLLALKDKGVTIFLTSHYMDEVETLCDRILVLNKGKEVASGTVADILVKVNKRNLEEAFLTLVGEEV